MSSLTPTDLVLMEQIVRVCQARGAFKPEEMVDVGNLFNRLTELVRKQKEEEKGAEAGAVARTESKN